jgi:hypothetical protein
MWCETVTKANTKESIPESINLAGKMLPVSEEHALKG